MVTNNHNNAKESPLINGYMQISGALSMFINGLKNNQMVIEELDKKFSGFGNLKESHSQLNLLTIEGNAFCIQNRPAINKISVTLFKL